MGIDPTTVVVTSLASQGGTVINNGDGTVTYTPPLNFLGIDTFTYTVEDTFGVLSNAATARVNVVRAADLPPL